MAVSRPIQALAPAYQGLLGLKNMGNLPTDQPDTVQPVISMLDFYLQGRRRALSVGTSAVNGASLGFVALATAVAVPQNKTWYVMGGSLILSIAAAQVLAIQAKLYAASSLSAASLLPLSDPVTVGAPNTAATAILGAGVSLAAKINPFILQGGDALAYTVDWANGAGAGTLQMNLLYAEVDQ